MADVKKVLGIILSGLALLFAIRVPDHLHSADPHQASLLHVDYVLIFIFGASGLTLFFSGLRRNTKHSGKSKATRPGFIAALGIGLILLAFLVSHRSIILAAGKVVVVGRVVGVDQPKIPASGKAIYHVTYQYTDAAGVTRFDNDVLYSTIPIVDKSQIDVAYSSYKPSISRLAHATRSGLYVVALGIVYEIWAVALLMRRKRPPPLPVETEHLI